MAHEPSHAAGDRAGRGVLERLPRTRPVEPRRWIEAGSREGMGVRMTPNAAWITVDPEHVVNVLQQDAVEKVNRGDREVILDFSSVLRIDGNAVGAMGELARLADDRSAVIVLHGVN